MTTNTYPNDPRVLEKLKNVKMFVLDMDGTIYLDRNPLPGAIEFCRMLDESGRLIYFTNNASRSPLDYVKRLNDMGFPAARKNILTSGDVTTAYLKKHHPGKPVYLLGTPTLAQSFEAEGICLSEDADIVVVSFDKTLTYDKLEHACTLIRGGAKFYATHQDINCPTASGFIPDCGAICEAIRLSTGVPPRYFGKPNQETAEMLCDFTGLKREEIAVVGDRLYTDIALGAKNGMLSILVMSGETTEEMRVSAPEGQRAALVFHGVYELTPLLSGENGKENAAL